MAVEFVEPPKRKADNEDDPNNINDDKSLSSASQVTDDPALKDSKSGRSQTTTSQSGDASSDEADKFVRKETRHVFYLRSMVLMLLFAASAAISLVVFFVTSAGEDTSFE